MVGSIQIQVNGQSRACRAGATVGELLRELDITIERVAVELNLEILDRTEFDHRGIKEGDRLEILSFIGGGSPSMEAIGVTSVLAERARVGMGGELVRAHSHVECNSTFIACARSMRAMEATPNRLHAVRSVI
jgi:sulfur carrier protein